MANVKAKQIYNSSVYIDPLHCGSKVSATIHRTVFNRITGRVELSDCDRTIKWDFWAHSYYDGLKKINNAIAELAKFRTQWIDATSGKYTRGRKKKKAKKPAARRH